MEIGCALGVQRSRREPRTGGLLLPRPAHTCTPSRQACPMLVSSAEAFRPSPLQLCAALQGDDISAVLRQRARLHCLVSWHFACISHTPACPASPFCLPPLLALRRPHAYLSAPHFPPPMPISPIGAALLGTTWQSTRWCQAPRCASAARDAPPPAAGRRGAPPAPRLGCSGASPWRESRAALGARCTPAATACSQRCVCAAQHAC